MTFKDYIESCQMYPYSKEYFEDAKLAAEIDLQTLWLEQQMALSEHHDSIMAWNPDYFHENACGSQDDIAVVIESVGSKISGFFKKIWTGIKNLFKRVGRFFGLVKEKKKKKKKHKKGGKDKGGESNDRIEIVINSKADADKLSNDAKAVLDSIELFKSKKLQLDHNQDGRKHLKFSYGKGVSKLDSTVIDILSAGWLDTGGINLITGGDFSKSLPGTEDVDRFAESIKGISWEIDHSGANLMTFANCVKKAFGSLGNKVTLDVGIVFHDRVEKMANELGTKIDADKNQNIKNIPGYDQGKATTLSEANALLTKVFGNLMAATSALMSLSERVGKILRDFRYKDMNDTDSGSHSPYSVGDGDDDNDSVSTDDMMRNMNVGSGSARPGTGGSGGGSGSGSSGGVVDTDDLMGNMNI